MGKIMRMPESDIDKLVSEFREALIANPRVVDGKVGFTHTFQKNERKAKIHFTETASIKMKTLIESFDKEIAWHGVAFRDDDPEKDEYYIADILVYPQEVTGATVTTDQTKYQMWLYDHDDDVFNNIRFQGHSHVRMAVSPSPTDESLYERLLGMCREDDFYIFGIWNKNNARNVEIYDMKKNMVFDNSEISIDIIPDGLGIMNFLKDAESMVEEKKYVPAYQGSGYQGYGYQGGQHDYYSGYQSGYQPAPKNAANAAANSVKPAVPVAPAASAEVSAANGKKKKKKRVDPGVARIALYGGSRLVDVDDDENPYSAFGHT